MIRSFKSPKLRRFFKSNITTGIQQKHCGRLTDILSVLSAASSLEDMKVPGWNLHPLKGIKPKRWSLSVDENWRITFEFKDGNAYLVHYEDYH